MDDKMNNLTSKQRYYRSPRGFLLTKYSSQENKSKYINKARTNNQSWPLPTYTKEEFISYWINNPIFIKLYNQWVESDFNRYSSPSFDRIDNTKGYSFDNIKLVTWRENIDNYHKDKAYLAGTGVIAYDLDYKQLYHFNSMAEASRKLNIPWRSIQRCCHGGRQSTHGYRFSFDEKKRMFRNNDIYKLSKERKRMYH